MKTASSDCDHIAAGSKPDYRNRRGFRSRGSIAELPVGIRTPCENTSVVFECETVGIARSNRDNSASCAEPAYVDRRGFGACRSITKLAA
jgi:hypothetical protein